jgi:hypothetical protein
VGGVFPSFNESLERMEFIGRLLERLAITLKNLNDLFTTISQKS